MIMEFGKWMRVAAIVIGAGLMTSSIQAAPKGSGGSTTTTTKSIAVTAELVTPCSDPNAPCETVVGGNNFLTGVQGTGTFSVLSDTGMPYGTAADGSLVQSEILTHNTVYTLDTLDTLVNGGVGSTTRFVEMHFMSTYVLNDGKADPTLPACWDADLNPVRTDIGGNAELLELSDAVNAAVNWSVFSDNQTDFTDLAVGESIGGSARMDFNYRKLDGSACDNQIFRFWLNWSRNTGVQITRLANVGGKRQWAVTTDSFGESVLRGQGGRGKDIKEYGSFRMPFELILTEK